jgi:hypothetical protein
MQMPKKVARTSHQLNHCLPTTPMEIGSKTYNLCYDLSALCDAEQFFNRRCRQVNLLQALTNPDVAPGIEKLFPCLVHTYHPELSFNAAQKILTQRAAFAICSQIAALWNDAGPPAPAAVDAQIKIRGTTYNLRFDLAALADAEEHFTRQGYKVGLWEILEGGDMSCDVLRRVFSCALHQQHPEIGFKDAQRLISFGALYVVSVSFPVAWEAATEEERQAFGLRIILASRPNLATGHA